MAGEPTTSIVIATYGRARLLQRVLGDLAATPLPSALVEILVVENGERDTTEAVCHRYAGVIPIRYHHVAESGKSNALNVGIDLSTAEFVIQLDDDVRVVPGAIGAFIDAAARFGPGHFFGGPVEPEYEGEPPSPWLRPWLTTCVVGWDLGRQERPHDEFLGANWAAFRADMLRVGGYIKDLGPTAGFSTLGEEIEMQKQLTAHGCTGIYVPEAKVRHYVRREQCTLEWVRKRWHQQSLSRVLISPTYLEAPQIAGAPRFLWRQYLTQLAKVTAARLIGPRTERRMSMEMQLAATVGEILGYRRVRRLGSPAAPTGSLAILAGPSAEDDG